ncbi:MAG: SusC/RagA family TonB-linked outer membrane protein [Chitinophagaceae bacterium]|nr:SusC/RagA family TonB-linked outer membrane protein [Chitinophagaceae bacterium]
MRKILMFTWLMLCAALAFSQTRVVTGKVTSEAGTPVPFASITLKGTNTGTAANQDGNFRISAKSGDVLVISSQGYGRKEVSVGTGSVVNVSLTSQVADLTEVVVSAGYNTRRTQRSTVSNAQVVTNEQLTTIRQTNLNSALAGKVAGIQVRGQSTAALGRDANIRLRGEAALGGSSLLYVVDGTVTNSVDINPDDIEDLTVLNGPSGAAIYGPQAASGVMVITTRRAKKGQKGLGIEVNSGMQWDKLYILPNYQNVYAGGGVGNLIQFTWKAGMPDEWKTLDGKFYHDYTDDASWGPRMVGQEYIPWYSWYPGTKYTGTTTKLLPQPDNGRDFYNTGVTANNNISVGAAGEHYNTRFSYTNVDVKGLIPNSWLKKNTLATNASIDLGEHFNIGTNLTYVTQRSQAENNDAYSNQSTGSFNQWFHRNLDMNIMEELRDMRSPLGTLASWNHANPTSFSASDPGSFYKGNYWYNMYSYFDNVENLSRRDRLSGDVNVTYKLNDQIKIRGAFRKNYVSTTGENKTYYLLESSATQTGQKAAYSTGQSFFNDDRVELTATYVKKISDFNIDFLVGGEGTKITQSSLNANTRNGLYIPDYFSLNNSIDAIAQSNSRQLEKRKAVFTRGSLGWRNMLFGEVTLRNDWFSALPAEKNNIFVKSFGASFVFSDLIRQSVPWLSFGKLRASWGEVPQAISPYQLELAYGVGADQFTGNFVMTTPNQIINPNISGAIRTTAEIGLELRVLKNRLGISATYYNANTTNAPVTVQINGASGFTSSLVNAGKIAQKGFDLQLNATPVRSKNFQYTINAAFSKVIDNKVVELAPGIDQIAVSGGANFTGITTPLVVHQVGQQWGMLIGGGKKYIDGLPVVDASGNFVKEENKKFGSVLPDFTGGVQNSISYKGFILNVNIDYQQGGKFFSLSDMWGSYSGLLARTAGVNDKENPIRDAVADGGGVKVVGITENKTPVSLYMDAQTYYHSMVSANVYDDFVYDLTFVKLRELSIGYKLPLQKWGSISKHIQSASISLVARNPWLIYATTRDFDPSEISNTYGENGQFPGTRSIGFNVKLGF